MPSIIHFILACGILTFDIKQKVRNLIWIVRHNEQYFDCVVHVIVNGLTGAL